MDLKELMNWKNFIGAVIVSIISVIYFIYDKGVAEGQKAKYQFDSMEQKFETIQHVKHAPDPIEFQKEHFQDSVFRKAMYRFIKQDSIDKKDIKKHIHNIDSIQWLNADQLYQAKKELQEIKSRQ